MSASTRTEEAPRSGAPPQPGAASWGSIAARLARTIVVVSVESVRGYHGMTADSFTLVSHEPMLVGVAVGAGGRTHRLLASAGGFGVSVLGEEQAAVAAHFASRGREPGLRQFDPVSWRAAPHSGAPVLTQAVAWLDCAIRAVIPAGDHVLVMGKVVEAEIRFGSGPPLVRWDGRYHAVGPDPAGGG